MLARSAPVEGTDVDAFVQVLLDEREITKLCYRYATALDSRDWELLRSCFLPEAVAEYEGLESCEGYEAIEELCRGALARLTRSQHLIGNVYPLVDGKEATSECYLQAQHVRAGAPGGDTFIVAGRYSDELVRTEEGWRIARRRLATWWTSGNPAVLAL
jgi:3-phenylpropionate/cinnamic acid dioxygenase small subunit